MKEKESRFQREDSLIEKKKFLLFLRMSMYNNSLKNHTLIGKMKKEIAREMTLMNRERKTRDSS